MRYKWMDTARTIAILMVVFCHATECYYGNILRGESYNEPFLSWLFQTVCFIIGRLGVPIFLMLSGALLLKKNFKDAENVIEFYKKNFISLMMCVEIWIILNRCFYHVFYRTSFSVIDLCKEMLFLQNSPLSHMWYMPMILGLYLVIPFLAVLVQHFSEKILFIPIGLAIGVYYIFPMINKLSSALEFGTISLKFDTSFLGGIYGVYLVLGYLIVHRNILKNISEHILVILFILMFTTLLMMQYFLFSHHFAGNILWYSCINILIMGVILFEWLRRYGEQAYLAIFKEISVLSLGIYFIHKPILMVLKSLWENIFIANVPISIFSLFIICSVSSTVVAEALSKIGVVSKYLLHMKR